MSNLKRYMPQGVLLAIIKMAAAFIIGFTVTYALLALIRWVFGAVAAAWAGLIIMIACWAWLFAIFMPASWLRKDE